MREIKFRAWDGKEMIDSWMEIIRKDATTHGDITIPERYTPSFNMSTAFAVMQFTGLTDKNGVDVYEGDIIHTDWQNRQGDVIYTRGSFVLKQDFEITPLLILVENKWKMHVLGNIYEHPNLLDK